jgi:hypothetical protein
MIVQRVIDILSRIVVDAFNNAPQATGRKAEPNTGGLLIAGPSGFPGGPVLLWAMGFPADWRTRPAWGLA